MKLRWSLSKLLSNICTTLPADSAKLWQGQIQETFYTSCNNTSANMNLFNFNSVFSQHLTLTRVVASHFLLIFLMLFLQHLLSHLTLFLFSFWNSLFCSTSHYYFIFYLNWLTYFTYLFGQTVLCFAELHTILLLWAICYMFVVFNLIFNCCNKVIFPTLKEMDHILIKWTTQWSHDFKITTKFMIWFSMLSPNNVCSVICYLLVNL